MMPKLIKFFCLLLLIFSCSCKRGEIVDVSNPQKCRLEDLSSDLHIIPLEQDDTCSYAFDPFSIKVYGSKLFMYDAHTRTVRYYDNGILKGILNKLGRGYGEYIDIGTYAYNVNRDEFVLFERNTQKLKYYCCKDFSFIKEISMDKYISAMEYLSGDRFLFVNDIPYEETTTSADVFDEETGAIVSSIPIAGVAAELIEDCALSRNDDGTVSFVMPGYENIVYHVDNSGFTEIERICFGTSGLSKDFWKGNEIDPFSGYEFFQKNKNKGVGVAPSFYHRENNNVVFWYISGYGEDEYHYANLSLFVKTGSKQMAVSQLSLDGVSKNLQPIGAADGYYYFFIEPEYITDTAKYGKNNPLLVYVKL